MEISGRVSAALIKAGIVGEDGVAVHQAESDRASGAAAVTGAVGKWARQAKLAGPQGVLLSTAVAAIPDPAAAVAHCMQ